MSSQCTCCVIALYLAKTRSFETFQCFTVTAESQSRSLILMDLTSVPSKPDHKSWQKGLMAWEDFLFLCEDEVKQPIPRHHDLCTACSSKVPNIEYCILWPEDVSTFHGKQFMLALTKDVYMFVFT